MYNLYFGLGRDDLSVSGSNDYSLQTESDLRNGELNWDLR